MFSLPLRHGPVSRVLTNKEGFHYVSSARLGSARFGRPTPPTPPPHPVDLGSGGETPPNDDDIMMKRESSERSIQMVEDPLAGLQRPVPRARNESASAAGTTVPIIDATKINIDPSIRQRSFTRIEGMEELERPIVDDSSHLSEAEKRMKVRVHVHSVCVCGGGESLQEEFFV